MSHTLVFVDNQSLHSFFYYRLFSNYLTSEFSTIPSLLYYFALQQALQSPAFFEAIPKSFQHFQPSPPSSSSSTSPLLSSFNLHSFLSKFDLSQIELFLLALSFITAPDLSVQRQAENIVQRYQSVFYLHTQSNPIPPFLKERFDKYSNSAPSSPKPPDMSDSSALFNEPLVGILNASGYDALSTAETFRRIIAQVINSTSPSVFCNETAVAQSLCFMSMHPVDYSTAEPLPNAWSHIISETTAGFNHATKWNVDSFVTVVMEMNPDLNWAHVIEQLDQASFRLQSLYGLELILDVYKKATNHQKFPLHIFFKPWKTPFAQYLMLAQLVSASPSLFNFADYTAQETEKVVPPEELAIASSSSTTTSIVTLPNQALNSLDVWATLVHFLQYPECRPHVTEFLENASSKAPELSLLGLARLPFPWDPLHASKVKGLIHEYLLGAKPTSSFVLPELWKFAPSLVLNSMVELIHSDLSLLPSFVDTLINLNGLDQALLSFPSQFALDAAVLACRKNVSCSETWFEQRYTKTSTKTEATKPIETKNESKTKLKTKLKTKAKAKANNETEPEVEPETGTGAGTGMESETAISSKAENEIEYGGGDAWFNACIGFLKVHANASSDRPFLPSSFGNQLLHFIQSHAPSDLFTPELESLMETFKLKLDSSFHRDIEAQCIRFFDLFYTDQLSLTDFISKLFELKEASDQTSQDTFLCTLMTFMDETKYIHTYPERNLMIAASFLGQLLFHQLLTPLLTERALSFLLEALGQKEANKLFHFGFTALGHFIHRVTEFPKFAETLIQLPMFLETAPEVAQLIRQKISTKPFTSLYPDPSLLGGDGFDVIEFPPDTVQDKVLFVINNLSPSNMDIKSKEASELLIQEYSRWFAQYLVTKRAPLEPNFHQLYLQFLTQLGSDRIWNCMLFETLTLIDLLLNSDKTPELTAERSKLKHLGSWLGGLTLARDKPLLHKHLAVKQLLMEGFQHGRLMIVVPFVCKVLEQCKFSKVFRPPNPWSMANLAFLVELYQFAELKLNLKFEIEVLCKNLSIELSDIQPTSLLQKLSNLQLSLAGYTSNLPFTNNNDNDNTSSKTSANESSLTVKQKSVDQLVTSMSQLSTAPSNLSSMPSSVTSPLSASSSTMASSNAGMMSVPSVPASSTSSTHPLSHSALISNMVGVNRGDTAGTIPSSSSTAATTTTTTSVAATPSSSSASSTTSQHPLSTLSTSTSLHPPSHQHPQLPPFLQIPNQSSATSSGALSSGFPNFPSPQLSSLTPSFGTQGSSSSSSLPPGSSPKLPTDYSNVTLANLASYILVNPNVTPIAAQPSFKRIVCLAVERTIREVLSPVVERAVTIAGMSTRELILKDFALEPDDMQLRKAAHMMAQYLAGGLAMVTCKEPIKTAMITNLRTLLHQNGVSDQTVSDAAVFVLVNDNIELGCHIIRKTAMEKAIPDIEEHLSSTFEERKQARELGKSLVELQPGYRRHPLHPHAHLHAQQHSHAHHPHHRLYNLPDPLRMKPTGLAGPQLTLYDEFGRNPVPEASLQDIMKLCVDKFLHYMQELDSLLTSTTTSFEKYTDIPMQHEIREIIRQIPLILPHNQVSEQLALLFCSKVIQPLYQASTELIRDVYSLILRELCSQSVMVSKEVVQWLLYSDDERKHNEAVTCSLIKCGLLNLNDVDVQIAKWMEAGRDVFNYGIGLVEICVKEGVAMVCDWFNILDVLNRMLLSQKNPPERVKTFMTQFRQRLKTVSTMTLDPMDPNTKEQAQLINEQLAYTFAEWVRLYHHPSTTETMLQMFILELQKYPIFNNDDTFCLFFRICTQISIDAWLKSFKSTSSPALAYQAIDAFAKLIILLTKYQAKETVASPTFAAETSSISPSSSSSSSSSSPTTATATVASPSTLTQSDPTFNATEKSSSPTLPTSFQTKLALFSKIISIIVLVLVHNHETQKSRFNQKPFFRLFASLLTELNASEHSSPQLCFSMLHSLSTTLHTLQPVFLPGFAFSWLSLIAHRQFMPKLLLMDNQIGWPLLNKLLLDLFRFLVPFLRDAKLREPTRLLYKGTLRVLLVLLHDFPEFLCEYYCTLCSVIPPNCLQLRNLILSAFPRNMRLPDPFTPNLRMEALVDAQTAPVVHTEGFIQLLQTANVSLTTWDATSIAAKFKFMNNKRDEVTSSVYNVHLINAVVFLAGMDDPEGRHLSFYYDVLIQLDSEGRYHVLSALVNHLRYPNAHTRYFASILLSLFQKKDNDTSLQEQITRVLLERLIVNRPHPWGLLVTFIELIRDPQYGFWNYGFTRCAPDIERLFDSVSRSVNQH